MLATLIIVFREIIEAGLIVGIVLAATRGVPHRGRWICYGIGSGVFGACLVAFFADSIASSLAGIGQEVFNASILLVAVAMLAWHNVWMASHGREMALQMKNLGHDVSQGTRSLMALATVVGIAILREGSEIVLFLYGVATSGNETMGSMVIGGVTGLLIGGIISALMYLGLLKIHARHLFSVTTTLITLLAAGMAAQAGLFLQQAGTINVLTDMVWDTSWLLKDSSIIGKALGTLVGYTDRPNQLQLLMYGVTLLLIFCLMYIFKPARKTSITA